MSYTLHPILIDLDKLRATVGSRDVKLIQQVVAASRESLMGSDAMGDDYEDHEEEIEAEYDSLEAGELPDFPASYADPDEDEDEAEAPRETTAGAALAHLVMGAAKDPSLGWKYGYALEALAKHVGEGTDLDQWNSIRYVAFEAADEALSEAGVSEQVLSTEGMILGRGSPVEIPDVDDFPSIGYLTRAEAAAAHAALETDAVAAAVAESDADDWLGGALEELSGLLNEAAESSRDLLFFYY